MVIETASSSRKHGTIEIFEKYWVEGRSLNIGDEEEFVSGATIKQRGIPTRSPRDAQRLRNGEVQVTDLWEKYLSTFQLKLAQELWTLRQVDMQEAYKEEE